ncbi:MAG: squalene/phytoene synthase family protein [Halobacteriaceae archaeon]
MSLDRSADDVAWCYDAVQRVSRTFALTVSQLSEPMSRDICVGYLLCRVADTVEDATHVPPADQRRVLETYGRVLDPADPTKPDAFADAVAPWVPEDHGADWAVVADAPRVLRVFEAMEPAPRRRIRGPVRELVDGMATFVDRYAEDGGLRLQTVEELEEYCWYVAGTVGVLVSDLLAVDGAGDGERLREHARPFSLLLQLVNVTRDVRRDYAAENNVYVPREYLETAGLDAEDIADPSNGEAFAPVVERLVDRATGYLDGAQAWLEVMPRVRGNTLSAWAIPFLLAVGTLRELDARPGEVVGGEPVKVSRAEVRAVVQRFEGDAEPDVAALRETIRRRPLHLATGDVRGD